MAQGREGGAVGDRLGGRRGRRTREGASGIIVVRGRLAVTRLEAISLGEAGGKVLLRGMIRDVDLHAPPPSQELSLRVRCRTERWAAVKRVVTSGGDGGFNAVVPRCSGALDVRTESSNRSYLVVKGRRISFQSVTGEPQVTLEVPRKVRFAQGVLQGAVTLSVRRSLWEEGRMRWKIEPVAGSRLFVRIGGGPVVSRRSGADGRMRFSVPLAQLRSRGRVTLEAGREQGDERLVRRDLLVLGRLELFLDPLPGALRIGDRLHLSGRVRVGPGGIGGIVVRLLRDKHVVAEAVPEADGRWELNVALRGTAGGRSWTLEAAGPFVDAPARRRVSMELLPAGGFGFREKFSALLVLGALLLLLGATAGGRRLLDNGVRALRRNWKRILAGLGWRTVPTVGEREQGSGGRRTLAGLIKPRSSIRGSVVLEGLPRRGRERVGKPVPVTLTLRSFGAFSMSHGQSAGQVLPNRQRRLALMTDSRGAASFGPLELPKGTWELTCQAPGHMPATQVVRIPHRGQYDDVVLVLDAVAMVVLRRFLEAIYGYGVRWNRERRSSTAVELCRELGPLLDPVEQGLLSDLRELLEQTLYAESEPTLRDASMAQDIAERIANFRVTAAGVKRHGGSRDGIEYGG